LTRALADYIAAASLVSVELGNAAQPNWYQRQLMHLPMFRPGSFLMEVLFRLMTGSRVDDRAREFQRARAEVVLLAPDDVVALVHAVDELFYAWQAKPGPEYWERWIDLKDKLRVEAQRAINERQGRRYRFRRSGRDPDSDAAFTPDRHPAPAAARGDA
jgi:hypothetical protein